MLTNKVLKGSADIWGVLNSDGTLALSGSHNVVSDEIDEENRDAADNEEAIHNDDNSDEDRMTTEDNEEEKHDDANLYIMIWFCRR
jgi:hypothetical protein